MTNAEHKTRRRILRKLIRRGVVAIKPNWQAVSDAEIAEFISSHEDPLDQAKENGEGAGWLDFVVAGACVAAVTAWASLVRWFTLRRECKWCREGRYIGGNPFARTITYGICDACFRRVMREELAKAKGAK